WASRAAHRTTRSKSCTSAERVCVMSDVAIPQPRLRRRGFASRVTAPRSCAMRLGMRTNMAVFTIAVVATAALVGAALSTHPQGNIARVAPFAAAAALVWLLALAKTGGARPAAWGACLIALSASLAVLIYILWIEPIPYA